MTGTDRGAERRRLLAAVGNDGESDGAAEDGDSKGARGDRPEPTPDGGTITLDGPLFYCARCDRTYLEEPATCDSCGGVAFERRTA